MTKDPEDTGNWLVRDVTEDTKRKIRIYAASNGLTIASAMKDMIDYAFSAYNASKDS